MQDEMKKEQPVTPQESQAPYPQDRTLPKPKRFSTFQSSDGKHQLLYRVFEPAEGVPVRGIFQLIHGLGEYHGRYGSFIRWLLDHGYIVYAHDHLGHGINRPKSDPLCHVGGPGGGKHLVEDTRRFTLLAQKEHPDLPLVIFGHSMGSLILRRYLELYGSELDPATTKIIISGTGIVPKAGMIRALLYFLRLGKGGWARFSPYAMKQFLDSVSDKEAEADPNYTGNWLTPDPVGAANDDPYCKSQLSLGTFNAVLEIVQGIGRESKEDLASIPKKLPILIISGEDDAFGDHGNGPTMVHYRYISAGLEDVRLELFPGLRHEIVNHRGAEPVLATIEEFLDLR